MTSNESVKVWALKISCNFVIFLKRNCNSIINFKVEITKFHRCKYVMLQKSTLEIHIYYCQDLSLRNQGGNTPKSESLWILSFIWSYSGHFEYDRVNWSKFAWNWSFLWKCSYVFMGGGGSSIELGSKYMYLLSMVIVRDKMNSLCIDREPMQME